MALWTTEVSWMDETMRTSLMQRSRGRRIEEGSVQWGAGERSGGRKISLKRVSRSRSTTSIVCRGFISLLSLRNLFEIQTYSKSPSFPAQDLGHVVDPAVVEVREQGDLGLELSCGLRVGGKRELDPHAQISPRRTDRTAHHRVVVCHRTSVSKSSVGRNKDAQ